MTMVQSDRPIAGPIANPMGTDGFEFVEYIGPTRRPWRRCSNAWGSSLRHRSKNVTLYKQGDIISV
jgi:4-hydroxyphenylpyruvate dioxygenase